MMLARATLEATQEATLDFLLVPVVSISLASFRLLTIKTSFSCIC